jgi:hypothetical protein
LDKKLTEYIMLGICTALAIYFVINFDERVGLIYGLISLLTLNWYYLILDKHVGNLIYIEKDSSKRLLSVLYAVVAYVCFIFTAGFVTSWLSKSKLNYIDLVNQAVSQTFSAAPVLSGSNTLKEVIWGVIIPRVETTFFFVIFPLIIFALFKSKYPTKVISKGAALLYTVFAGLFMLNHAAAKGITDNSALSVTIIFGIISLVLIVQFQQQAEAIFLHIITNSIGTMKQLNIGFYSTGTFSFSVGGLTTVLLLLTLTWFLLYVEVPGGNFINKLVRS